MAPCRLPNLLLCALAALRAVGAARLSAVQRTARDAERRILSVGDLHGDLEATQYILSELELLGPDGGWVGGDAVLVQVGDVADRGNQSKQIYDLLFKLQEEAPKQGGEVLLLLGNHEQMNMEGQHHYMTPEDMKGFGGPQAMRYEFSKGELRKKLQQLPIMVRLGEKYGLQHPLVFVHAGLEKPLAAGLSAVAKLATGPSWSRTTDPGDRLVKAANEAARAMFNGRTRVQGPHGRMIMGPHGPLWTRKLSQGEQPCPDLNTTLSLLNAARMVVGHTIQEDTKVHEKCDGRLVLEDTAISAGFVGVAHPSAVQFFADGCARALYFGANAPVDLSCVEGVPPEAPEVPES